MSFDDEYKSWARGRVSFKLEGVMGGGGLNGKGKVDEVSWGFGPPDCPPSRKSKKHTSEQLGRFNDPKRR